MSGNDGGRKRKYKSYLFDDCQDVPYRTLQRSKGNHDGSDSLTSVNFNPDQPAASSRTDSSAIPPPEDHGTEDISSASSSSVRPSDDQLDEGDLDTSLSSFSKKTITTSSSLSDGTDEDELSFSDSYDELSNVDVDDAFGTEGNADNIEDDFLQKPMYENSPINVGTYLAGIFDLYSKHKLSKSCFEDILKLTIKTIPKPNNLPGTKYKLFKYLENLTKHFVPRIHEYCVSCTSFIDPVERNVMDNCPTCGSLDKGFFASISVKNCILNLINNCDLSKYLIDQDKNIDMSDILCSISYKGLKATICPGKYDITLVLNSDGVPLAKSSSMQLWPLQATINELPPHLRQHFMIVCGVWVGENKPNMNTFLKPLCEELSHDSRFTWTHPETKMEISSIVAISCISVDSPARAMMQNISQFNGKFGCNFCEQEGICVVKGRGHARVYPIQEQPDLLRTKEKMLNQAQERDENKRCGVKGHSILSIINYCDIPSVFVPDYMHSVLLGVVRQYLHLWFDSSNSCESWYIGPSLRREINEEISNIKPPDVIVRLPRSIEKRSSWKAAELRSWLLYYSVPLLYDKLRDKYFQHWLLLVKAIFLLLKEKITEDEIKLAQILLRCFVRDTEVLYSLQECTFNVHLLLHLASSVRNWGPLWANSCFPFESNNGYLLKLIHGTKNLRAELVNSLKMVNLNQVLKYKTTSVICHEHLPAQTIKKYEEIGAPVNHQLPVDVHHQLEKVEGSEVVNAIKVYNRAKLSGEIFTSNLYVRETKRNSCTVRFKAGSEISPKYGEIQYYVVVDNGQDKRMYAVINTFTVNRECFIHVETGLPIDHISSVSPYQTNVLVNINHILNKVVNLWSKYICCRPNFIERNL